MTVSNVLKLAVFACIALASAGLGSAQKGQGADGNPHGWDRKRRCDHAGYTPKCGLCEGYGGIPYGKSDCVLCDFHGSVPSPQSDVDLQRSYTFLHL